MFERNNLFKSSSIMNLTKSARAITEAENKKEGELALLDVMYMHQRYRGIRSIWIS